MKGKRHLQWRAGQLHEKHGHIDQLPCHTLCHQYQSDPAEESEDDEE